MWWHKITGVIEQATHVNITRIQGLSNASCARMATSNDNDHHGCLAPIFSPFSCISSVRMHAAKC